MTRIGCSLSKFRRLTTLASSKAWSRRRRPTTWTISTRQISASGRFLFQLTISIPRNPRLLDRRWDRTGYCRKCFPLSLITILSTSLCVLRDKVSMMSTQLWCCSLFHPDAPSRSAGPPPSAYRFPVLSTDQIGQGREKFCSKRKSEAPSNGGKPQNFLPGQYELDQQIPCNRPYGLPTALPLSLLHPIFGEFVDDAENYVPTPDDVPFFLEFVEAMANIYKGEDSRKVTVLNIFEKHKMYIKPSSIGKYITDGDLSSGEFRSLIFEFKNEIGSTAAEPFLQAILFYLEATRKFAVQYRNSVLPCIIVLIFGALSFLNPSFILSYTIQALTWHLLVLHGLTVRPYRCCPLPSHAIIKIPISRWRAC